MRHILSLFFLVFTTVSFAQSTVGLVGHYTFSGNAADSSGFNNHGIVHGATLTTDRFGNPNSAYDFDGNGQYIRIGDIFDIDDLDGLTISAWMKPESLGDQDKWAGISFGTKSSGEVCIRIRKQFNQQFQAHLAEEGLTSSTIGSHHKNSTNYQFNTWYHVVGVFKNGMVKLYLNSIPQLDSLVNNGGATLNDIPDSSVFRIGKAYNTNDVARYFNGSIDDVRIYTRALIHEHVIDIYLAEKPISIEDPIAVDEFIIFPNPSNESFSIKSEIQNNATVLLQNSSGQMIRKWENQNVNRKYDVQGLSPGIYYLSIITKRGVVNEKLLIQ